jgi:hypothetical protein
MGSSVAANIEFTLFDIYSIIERKVEFWGYYIGWLV